jgi:hypothetical protein
MHKNNFGTAKLCVTNTNHIFVFVTHKQIQFWECSIIADLVTNHKKIAEPITNRHKFVPAMMNRHNIGVF